MGSSEVLLNRKANNEGIPNITTASERMKASMSLVNHNIQLFVSIFDQLASSHAGFADANIPTGSRQWVLREFMTGLEIPALHHRFSVPETPMTETKETRGRAGSHRLGQRAFRVL